jgi:uncharacterized protein (DUF433 family)
MDYQSRITIEPVKRGGKPTIRSLRITVYDVLRLLAEGGHRRQMVCARLPVSRYQ